MNNVTLQDSKRYFLNTFHSPARENNDQIQLVQNLGPQTARNRTPSPMNQQQYGGIQTCTNNINFNNTTPISPILRRGKQMISKSPSPMQRNPTQIPQQFQLQQQQFIQFQKQPPTVHKQQQNQVQNQIQQGQQVKQTAILDESSRTKLNLLNNLSTLNSKYQQTQTNNQLSSNRYQQNSNLISYTPQTQRIKISKFNEFPTEQQSKGITQRTNQFQQQQTPKIVRFSPNSKPGSVQKKQTQQQNEQKQQENQKIGQERSISPFNENIKANLQYYQQQQQQQQQEKQQQQQQQQQSGNTGLEKQNSKPLLLENDLEREIKQLKLENASLRQEIEKSKVFMESNTNLLTKEIEKLSTLYDSTLQQNSQYEKVILEKNNEIQKIKSCSQLSDNNNNEKEQEQIKQLEQKYAFLLQKSKKLELDLQTSSQNEKSLIQQLKNKEELLNNLSQKTDLKNFYLQLSQLQNQKQQIKQDINNLKLDYNNDLKQIKSLLLRETQEKINSYLQTQNESSYELYQDNVVKKNEIIKQMEQDLNLIHQQNNEFQTMNLKLKQENHSLLNQVAQYQLQQVVIEDYKTNNNSHNKQNSKSNPFKYDQQRYS